MKVKRRCGLLEFADESSWRESMRCLTSLQGIWNFTPDGVSYAEERVCLHAFVDAEHIMDGWRIVLSFALITANLSRMT